MVEITVYDDKRVWVRYFNLMNIGHSLICGRFRDAPVGYINCQMDGFSELGKSYGQSRTARISMFLKHGKCFKQALFG